MGNENLISIKGHNSVTNLRKITGNNPKLDIVHINAHTQSGQFISIILVILNRNKKKLTSIMGHASVTTLRKMTSNNPKLDLIHINIQDFVKSYQGVLNILSGNENLTSIKGHNSSTNLQKIAHIDLKPDLVIINAHTQFAQILLTSSQETKAETKL